MRMVRNEEIYVCTKCHACDCHNMAMLSKPCIGPVFPED